MRRDSSISAVPAAIIVNTVLSVYVIIGTHLEEHKLFAAYGEYQQKVSMFLPVRWFKAIVLSHQNRRQH